MSRSSDWDPLRELSAVRERMNKLFEAALTRAELESSGGLGPWSPVADVHETADDVRVSLELPGLDERHLRVRVDGDELVVEGDRPSDRERPGDRFHRVERSYGKFARRFPLPGTVDRKSVEARYVGGVLEITLSKRAPDAPEDVPIHTR